MVSGNKTQTGATRSGTLAFALTTILFAALDIAYNYAWPNSAQSAEKNRLLGASVWQQPSTQTLPTPYERWTGDLDGMIKRQQVRALVAYSKTAFFYDQGRREGISYGALQEFQQTLNREFKTGNLPVTVTFLPLGYDQFE